MKTCHQKYAAERMVKRHAKCRHSIFVSSTAPGAQHIMISNTISAIRWIYLCVEDRFNDEDLLIRSQRAAITLLYCLFSAGNGLERACALRRHLYLTYYNIYTMCNIIYMRRVYSTPGQGLISTKTRAEVVFVVFFFLYARTRELNPITYILPIY